MYIDSEAVVRVAELHRELAELHTENERLRQDAERYRWAWNNGLSLEERGDDVWLVMEYQVGPTSLIERTVSDVIDALRGEEE